MIAWLAGIFGFIIRVIYNLLHQNYFWSIVIFTILSKLVLLPFTIMQIKSTEEMKKITPKMQKITDKYKNDKNKQAEELTKLYSEHKINPLGGCLPLLIQFPIIISMFLIVRQPLTYIVQLPQEQIKTYTQEFLNKEEVTENEIKSAEIEIANEKDLINMDTYFGINLGDTPSNVFSKDPAKKVPYISLIIPILTVVLSMVQMKLSMKNQVMTEEQAEMQKTNNIMMPALSGLIAYTMPLALGLYWLIGNVMQILQQIFIDVVIKRDEKKEEKRLSLGKGGN